MINSLKTSVLARRMSILREIRRFFESLDFLEVETPIFNPTGAVEPFLDAFRLNRTAPRKSPTGLSGYGFLTTSPEYNLKVLCGEHLAKYPGIYEIAHCFREGDSGPHHTEEFLMLEWYTRGDLNSLLKQTEALVAGLSAIQGPFERISVTALFQKFAECKIDFESLRNRAISAGLLQPGETPRYDEIFFSIFLNLIEPELRKPPISLRPLFIEEYPAELSALSVVQGNTCSRFELYWKGIELANAYYELRGRANHVSRFNEFNKLREQTGRPTMEFDAQFMDATEALPECSGIALGLDRLIMVLMDQDDLSTVSPFYKSSTESTDKDKR